MLRTGGSNTSLARCWARCSARSHSDWVLSVVYSPDGRYLASGSRQTIKIWQVATGKVLRTLTGHSDWVWSVVYSPDGRYLASGSYQTIKIWEVATGKVTAVVAILKVFGGNTRNSRNANPGKLLSGASFKASIRFARRSLVTSPAASSSYNSSLSVAGNPGCGH